MASIYNELKPLAEKLANKSITEEEAFDEFVDIWRKDKKNGKELRCTLKFVNDNIEDRTNADVMSLLIVATDRD